MALMSRQRISRPGVCTAGDCWSFEKNGAADRLSKAPAGDALAGDWLTENHLAFLISELVEELDLRSFQRAARGDVILLNPATEGSLAYRLRIKSDFMSSFR